MKRTHLITIICSSSLLLLSCGTGKKLQNAMNEINKLTKNINQLEGQNNDLQQKLAELTSRNNMAVAAFNEYKKDCEQKKEELGTVNELLDERYNALKQVQNKLEAAMTNFKDKGVDVYYKSGLVYVSLSDELLYKSGSANLNVEAKKALGSLASALADYPDLKVIVVGNTDDVQFKKGKDNWTLSTERATGVVRVLRDVYNVNPTRLTAAGKGKYDPVADNSSNEGKAKNRRTEIILNPDLVRLWDSVNP